MTRIDRSAALVVAFSTILALGVRLALVLTSGFPLNDGGLFYTFSLDLLRNGLVLPAYSSYNAADIPLAYPPLAFYLVAIFHIISRLPVLDIIQVVPAVLSAASVPAFYLLGAEMLPSRRQAALATLLFALIPRTSDWLIMGGGITRALGLLLALLAIRQAYLLFGKHSSAAVAPLAICSGLLLLSHPEASVHVAVTAGLLLLWHDRSRAALRRAAIVAGVALLISSPWWLSVVGRHGVDPFMAAAAAARADSYGPLAGVVALFRFEFTDEPFLTVVAVLGLIGMAVTLTRRAYFLPTWFAILHTVEPRGGTLFMMIPLALAASVCLDEVLLPALGVAASPPLDGSVVAWLPPLLRQPAACTSLAFLVIYGALGAYTVGERIKRDLTLQPSDEQALAWVRENTASDAEFVVVTKGLPLRDSSSEWFPAITERRSVATVYGLEWAQSGDFVQGARRYQSLQNCASSDSSCLDYWTAENGVNPDYIYVRPPILGETFPLQDSLAASAGYELAYTNSTVWIYRRR